MGTMNQEMIPNPGGGADEAGHFRSKATPQKPRLTRIRILVMLGIEAVLSTEEMANPVLVLIDKDLVHP